MVMFSNMVRHSFEGALSKSETNVNIVFNILSKDGVCKRISVAGHQHFDRELS